MPGKQIPPGVIAVVAPIISGWYTHPRMDAVFAAAGCPGDIPEGTKAEKAKAWLQRANAECREPLDILGYVLAEMFESADGSTDPSVHTDFERIFRVLKLNGLTYQHRGRFQSAGLFGPSRSLEADIRVRGIEAIEQEFERAYAAVEADPPAAVTAACAILESVCKTYLEDVGEPLPSKQTLDPLWTATAKHLGLDPSQVADTDLKKILSGLFSIAQGVSALRTHAGSAHGQSDAAAKRYRLQPRHARLAVHAAHTLAMFALETWDARGERNRT